MRLNHVTLPARDIAASIAFYQATLASQSMMRAPCQSK